MGNWSNLDLKAAKLLSSSAKVESNNIRVLNFFSTESMYNSGKVAKDSTFLIPACFLTSLLKSRQALNSTGLKI